MGVIKFRGNAKVCGCITTITLIYALRKKCSYSELFWSAFLLHCSAFGLNTERNGVQSECVKMREKMQTRIATNTDNFLRSDGVVKLNFGIRLEYCIDCVCDLSQVINLWI